MSSLFCREVLFVAAYTCSSH